MGEDNIHDRLASIWAQERNSQELTEIPKELFESLSKYVSGLRHKIRLTSKDSVERDLRQSEIEFISRLVRSIFTLRYRKILLHILRDRQPVNMLPFEKQFYNYISTAVVEYRDLIDMISSRFVIPQVSPMQNYELVAFLKDFPKIVGEDLREYGPFKAGDMAVLPRENARSLSKDGVVKRIMLL